MEMCRFGGEWYLDSTRRTPVNTTSAIPAAILLIILIHLCMSCRAIFEITKKKFHNVLQGVAEDDVRLESRDKKYFEAWMMSNYKKFWKDSGVSDSQRLSFTFSLMRSYRFLQIEYWLRMILK